MSDYDTDLLSWSERQATLLRRRAAGERVNDVEPDWPNIAEEIESVGRAERSTLTSHVGAVIEHLLKLEASPSIAPCAGWKETIIRTRIAIDDVLQDSPSLRPSLDAIIARAHGQRRRLVAALLLLHNELPRVALEQLGYTADQVLGTWLPADPH